LIKQVQVCPVSLSQLIRTIHTICKGLMLESRKKKKKKQAQVSSSLENRRFIFLFCFLLIFCWFYSSLSLATNIGFLHFSSLFNCFRCYGHRFIYEIPHQPNFFFFFGILHFHFCSNCFFKLYTMHHLPIY